MLSLLKRMGMGVGKCMKWFKLVATTCSSAEPSWPVGAAQMKLSNEGTDRSIKLMKVCFGLWAWGCTCRLNPTLPIRLRQACRS